MFYKHQLCYAQGIRMIGTRIHRGEVKCHPDGTNDGKHCGTGKRGNTRRLNINPQLHVILYIYNDTNHCWSILLFIIPGGEAFGYGSTELWFSTLLSSLLEKLLHCCFTPRYGLFSHDEQPMETNDTLRCFS